MKRGETGSALFALYRRYRPIRRHALIPAEKCNERALGSKRACEPRSTIYPPFLIIITRECATGATRQRRLSRLHGLSHCRLLVAGCSSSSAVFSRGEKKGTETGRAAVRSEVKGQNSMEIENGRNDGTRWFAKVFQRTDFVFAYHQGSVKRWNDARVDF